MNSSIYDKKFHQGDFIPFITSYYFKDWYGYEMRMHSHLANEIMYVINGSCTIFVDSKAIKMKKSDYILIDSNTKHRLFVEKDTKCRMFNIEFVFKRDCSSVITFCDVLNCAKSLKAFLETKKTYTLMKDNGTIYSSLKDIVLEIDRRETDYSTLTNIMLAKLFVLIARNYDDINSMSINSLIKKAIEYIHQHYDRQIKIDDIARYINIHQGYLYRIFKKEVKVTPNTYITNVRIQKAKMLLAQTDIPIIEVCNYVGINSRQYFSYLFKKETGMSPDNYRRDSQNFGTV